jgi:BolA family transcriptional regulator, general stress-responsive regulator
MHRTQRLNDVLAKTLAPELLQIENESNQHQVPEGSESHFKIIIVSTKFEKLNRISRHRLVFSSVSEEFKNMHALTLSLYTPSEWENKSKPPEASPKCTRSNKK